ncbi:hypothetical protein AJ80_00031 [Polytolypa hystricis UAMH7299]|uniref:F-box domain-containing protein n=1 Tax=Polytolypa hystricis (strain UAMH7299) TaxID=1447883 RepID=A0A2B7Z455_POLH7|nr:hypothetical protein AJ80_00031 [Polytolypa hystricis UAMH7299]
MDTEPQPNPARIALLPTELVLNIVQNLDLKVDLNAFSRTNKRIYTITNPYLYRRDVQYGECSSICWAIDNIEPTTAKYALDAVMDITRLDKHVPEQRETLLRLLIDRGVPLSRNSLACRTALHSAVSYRDTLAIRLLLEKGIRVDVTADDGTQPIHCTTYSYVEAIHFLIKHFAYEPDTIRQLFRLYHMDIPETCWKEAALGVLIENGADINCRNKRGKALRLLMVLLADPIGRLFHIPMLRYLLDNGANVNTTTHNGEIPLCYAASRGHAKEVELLVQFGADIHAQDNKQGNTPLHQATRTKNINTMKYLLEHGADPNARNNYRHTPLFYAVADGANSQSKDNMGKTIFDSSADFSESAMALVREIGL